MNAFSGNNFKETVAPTMAISFLQHPEISTIINNCYIPNICVPSTFEQFITILRILVYRLLKLSRID